VAVIPTQVFTTREHALSYRARCREKLMACPSIVTEDGWKISTAGRLMKTPIPEESELRFMFGEIPVQMTRGYKVRHEEGYDPRVVSCPSEIAPMGDKIAL
jgi:hypothetical protein